MRKGIIMKPDKNRGGYLYYILRKPIRQTFKAHSLVADAFVRRPRLEVNHKDGDKLNNRADNLEMVTHRENMRAAASNGAWEKHKKKT
jgi:hypothetical protein